MDKIILHLDMDSYFVSAHRSINPKLNNFPAVVSTGAKRGIIAASSYEAKALGIKVPMPLYRARALCPDLLIIKPDFNLYTLLASNTFEFLFKNYTTQIEIASIDEFYLDVTDIWKKFKSPFLLAKDIQNRILNELKLPVSIGVSQNKFVAKMATKVNKPFGITLIKQAHFLNFFKDEKVSVIHGIGAPTEKVLSKINIFTVNDLAHANLQKVVSLLGKNAHVYIDKANGIGSDQINFEQNDLKSIGNSVTFLGGDKHEIADVLAILETLALTISNRSQLRNLVGNVISLGIKHTGGKEISVNHKQITLDRAINDQKTIYKHGRDLLESLWDEKIPIKYIGLTLNSLKDIYTSSFQSSIFDKDEGKNRADGIVENVNFYLKGKQVVTGKEFINNIKKKQNQSKYLEGDRRVLKYYEKD